MESSLRGGRTLFLLLSMSVAISPNPFNPGTRILYTLPEAIQVRLEIFDVLGERSATLVDAWQDAGEHHTVFDDSGLPSGVYLYRLTAGADVSVKRMTLMK